MKSHLRQTLNEVQLRNLLGDKLWTPQATFHSVSEVRKWGIEEGLALTGTKKFFLRYANVMRFVKQGTAETETRRQLSLKCLTCGESEMSDRDSAYECVKCANTYEVDGGIIRSIN